MNDVYVWLDYRMHKRGEDAESGIRLRIGAAFAETLKSGNTVPEINAICHALARLQGYENGYYLCAEFEEPDGIDDCEECRLSMI